MQDYFPYSHIINTLCQNIKHSFFGEWNGCEATESGHAQSMSSDISELYY